MTETRDWPDVEVLVREYLTTKLATFAPGRTVAIGVPRDWTPAKPDHLQVELAGVIRFQSNVVATAVIRLVAWSPSTTKAKRLTTLAQSLLCAHLGSSAADGQITSARPLTGALADRDPDNKGEIAATTTRVTFRSLPIEPLGS